jgi:hypothetical protein
MNRAWRRIAVAFVFAMLPVPVAAQPALSDGPSPDGLPAALDAHQGRGSGAKAKDKGKAKNDAAATAPAGARVEIAIDRERERRVVVEYWRRGSLPPGLAKRESLPPGLARQLRERGHLPPGLEKHLYRLPPGLERDLPPLPPYYVRRMAGDDLLVIDIRANLLVAQIRAVFVHR